MADREYATRIVQVRPIMNNLPIQLTSFIGREREVAEVKKALSGARLLTLTGPGGCGKTRLAIQVANELVHEQSFDHGVWWVELAALVDPALTPQTIALTLGIHERADVPLLQLLVDYLQPKKLL